MTTDLWSGELPATRWGNKAARLSVAHARGFAVPPAVCVSPSDVAAPRIRAELDAWLAVHTPARVIARTSSGQEDTPTRARAGETATVRDLAGDATAIVAALRDELLPGAKADGCEVRGTSFVVQTQVDAVLAGVAFATAERVWVECARGRTDEVTAGSTPDVVLERCAAAWHAACVPGVQAPVLAAAHALGPALDGLRSVFGWDVDVEWAWSAAVLWVLQVRPVTVSPAPRPRVDEP